MTRANHRSQKGLEKRDGLTIVTDKALLNDLSAIAGDAPEDAVCDPLLRRLLGAELVFGSEEACNSERDRLLAKPS